MFIIVQHMFNLLHIKVVVLYMYYIISQLHATTLDSINGEANIANYWRNHFHCILNCNVCDQALKNSILGTLDDIQHDTRTTVCYTDVQTLIHKLEFGKSAGPDGICAEALKCDNEMTMKFNLFRH